MASQAIETYQSGTIRFSHPSNWTREVDRNDDGVTITLQSPGVSFALVAIYPRAEEPGDLIEEAIETLREEHPSLEVEDFPSDDWEDAAAAEVCFFSLDVVSYCWLRSGRVGDSTLLVLLQSADPEAEQAEALFQAMCRSVSAAS